MRRHIKFVVLLIFIEIFLSAGCQRANLRMRELNDSHLINVIGIDEMPGDTGFVQITTMSKEIKTGGAGEPGGSQGQQGSLIVSTKGRTVLEAYSNLYPISDKTPFLGHVKYILIGEDAAKKNIIEYLDLFFRYYEVRLNLIVAIVKGGSAEQLIRQIGAEEGFLGDKLKSVFKDKGDLSISDEIRIIDAMDMLDDEYASACIPCIYPVEPKHQDVTGDGKGPKVKLDGFGVFKGSKLVGYINGDTARGLNWIRGKIKSGLFILKDDQGNDMALEIIDANSKIKPKIIDGKLKVFIEIKMSSNIAEVQGTQDIANKKILDKLKRQQEKIVKDEIERVLSFAKEKNTDIFPISSVVWHKYPIQWESIKHDWDKIFPELEIHVKVDSIINRTYDIRQPIISKDGEE